MQVYTQSPSWRKEANKTKSDKTFVSLSPCTVWLVDLSRRQPTCEKHVCGVAHVFVTANVSPRSSITWCVWQTLKSSWKTKNNRSFEISKCNLLFFSALEHLELNVIVTCWAGSFNGEAVANLVASHVDAIVAGHFYDNRRKKKEQENYNGWWWCWIT